MKRFLPRLTYANVVATLALFLVLTGGAAYAAGKIEKNSVGTKQLKRSSITTAKIKNQAVTAAKIAAGTITSAQIAGGTITGAQIKSGSLGGAQIQPGSLTGADIQEGSLTGTAIQPGSLTGTAINQSTLTSVRASNVVGVALDGSCTPAAPFPAGVSAAVSGTGCEVTFPMSVLNCAATATAGFRTHLATLAEHRTVETLRDPEQPDQILTEPYKGEVNKAEPVDLILVC